MLLCFRYRCLKNDKIKEDIMIKYLFAAFLSISAYSQTLTLSAPSTVKQGKTVDLTISLAGVTGTGPVGAQWTLNAPAFTIGASTTPVANKSVTCGTTSAPICLVVGLNTTPLANSPIAVTKLTVPAATGLGSKTVTLSGVVGVSSTGSSSPLVAGAPISVVVTAIADIDNSGVVDASDVAAMANQVVAQSCSDDQNSDGVCNIIDVFLVVLKALGL